MAAPVGLGKAGQGDAGQVGAHHSLGSLFCMSITTRGTGFALSLEERRAVAQLISRSGEKLACKQLAINRGTLCRALAGLTVQRGTLVLVQQRLAALAKAVP